MDFWVSGARELGGFSDPSFSGVRLTSSLFYFKMGMRDWRARWEPGLGGT
jgi:hypothetical protein